MNSYGKFLPDLATAAAPLYALLRKATQWCWGQARQSAFKKDKTILQSSDLLVHFDPQKEIIIACDALLFGMGAVLSHCMEDGSVRPIAYASRSLSIAERKYSHLDKEALAKVYSVKHFHQYVYGHSFTIHSDHKPLMYIFDETKSVPSMTLTLRAYTYKIRYKAGRDNTNAEGFSLLLLPSAPADVPQPVETVLLMERLESSPVSAMDIRSHTNQDPVLSEVRELVMDGWPDTVEKEELQPFVKYRVN